MSTKKQPRTSDWILDRATEYCPGPMPFCDWKLLWLHREIAWFEASMLSKQVGALNNHWWINPTLWGGNPKLTYCDQWETRATGSFGAAPHFIVLADPECEPMMVETCYGEPTASKKWVTDHWSWRCRMHECEPNVECPGWNLIGSDPFIHNDVWLVASDMIFKQEMQPLSTIIKLMISRWADFQPY